MLFICCSGCFFVILIAFAACFAVYLVLIGHVAVLELLHSIEVEVQAMVRQV